MITTSVFCNIRSNVTKLRVGHWLLDYVCFINPLQAVCIKLIPRNLLSCYIRHQDLNGVSSNKRKRFNSEHPQKLKTTAPIEGST